MIAVELKLKRPRFSIDVAFNAGASITALFGPSGSGKSTVLNLISGLERPDSGRIEINGQVLFNHAQKIDVPAHKRRIAYVFQDALLFPHLSVRQNLLYGFAGGSIGLKQVVNLLDIGHLLHGRPATLSGGERQRVAIGRAILSAPGLLLMDEPLASLDLAHKREILPYIERLNQSLAIPVIYVSHAIDEVARLAGHVVVLKDGRVVDRGSPQAVLPPTETSSDRFARISVLLAGAESYDRHYRLTSFSHPAGKITLAGEFPLTHQSVRIVVRATDVTLARRRPDGISARTMLQGVLSRIEQSEDAVAIAHVTLDGGDQLAAALTRKAIDDLGLKPGDKVWSLLKSVSIDERWLAAP